MTTHSDRGERKIEAQWREGLEISGSTEVRRPVAVMLVALFVVTLGSVAIVDAWRGVRAVGRPLPALEEVRRGLAAASREVTEGGWIRADRLLLASMRDFEDRLEEESVLREELVPRVVPFLVRWLRAGSERALPGPDGRLYYLPDVDWVAGPPFLDRRVLARRAAGGDSWKAAPKPDPRPALREFATDLSRRGIHLVVVGAPLAPQVHPERLASGRAPVAPLDNSALPGFVEFVVDLGATWVETAPQLAVAAGRSGEPQFLAADTHWTPAAMEVVAEAIASAVEPHLATPGETYWTERVVRVRGIGDLATMMHLPEDRAGEEVLVRPVFDEFGTPHRFAEDADVLLLGDSFTNVFSDPSLGWGSGAGLGERLAFHLARPIDRISSNAGGASAVREVLAAELAAGSDRLEGKRVVVLEFALRDLASGDWRPAPLPAPPDPAAGRGRIAPDE